MRKTFLAITLFLAFSKAALYGAQNEAYKTIY